MNQDKVVDVQAYRGIAEVVRAWDKLSSLAESPGELTITLRRGDQVCEIGSGTATARMLDQIAVELYREMEEF